MIYRSSSNTVVQFGPWEATSELLFQESIICGAIVTRIFLVESSKYDAVTADEKYPVIGNVIILKKSYPRGLVRFKVIFVA